MLHIHKVLIVVLAFSMGAWASDDTQFNVDFVCGWRGYYRPMEWMPVEIGVSTFLEEPFGGSLTISAQQDEINTLNVVYEFVVIQDIPLYIPLVTKLAFATDKCRVRIDNERGREQWSFDYPLWDFTRGNAALIAVNESDILIGYAGQMRSFGLLRLPEQSVCRYGGDTGNVYLGDKQPRMVPWDWTGFACLDLFILYNPQWDMFNEHQLNAIAQWIHNGGKLLLVLGSHPFPKDNPLTRILPFEVRDTKQVTISPDILKEWGLIASEPEIVPCQTIVPKSQEPFFISKTYNENDCLFAIGDIGFGRVGVLAFDPETMREEQKAKSAEFWVLCIQEILEGTSSLSDASTAQRFSSDQLNRSIEFVRDAKSSINRTSNINRYNVGLALAANNGVMEHLYNISQMRPLSIWWVILLLGSLAVLLGPVDYKVLKSRGRLPWTWLTCTFWIVLFSIGAYFGVQYIRGGVMQLRIVSVLDGIENGRWAWSTNYCALFAPKSDDYKLEGLQPNQWWSSIAPTEISLSAFNSEIAGRKIFCLQHDGGNLPYSLPVNIWTIQCLLNESSIEKLPFSAEIERLDDQITVNIVNESDTPIQSGYVLLANNRGIKLGPVGGQTSRQFSDRLLRLRIWEDFERIRYQRLLSGRNVNLGFSSEDAFFAQGTLRRTEAIKSYLDQGAAVVCVQYDQSPPPFSVKGRFCENDHLQLARLVVFPKVRQRETRND